MIRYFCFKRPTKQTLVILWKRQGEVHFSKNLQKRESPILIEDFLYIILYKLEFVSNTE